MTQAGNIQYFFHAFNGFANVANTNWYLIFDSEAVFHVYFLLLFKLQPDFPTIFTHPQLYAIETGDLSSCNLLWASLDRRQHLAVWCGNHSQFEIYAENSSEMHVWMCDDMTARKVWWNMCKNDNSEMSTKNRRIIVKNLKFSSPAKLRSHCCARSLQPAKKEKLEQCNPTTWQNPSLLLTLSLLMCVENCVRLKNLINYLKPTRNFTPLQKPICCVCVHGISQISIFLSAVERVKFQTAAAMETLFHKFFV